MQSGLRAHRADVRGGGIRAWQPDFITVAKALAGGFPLAGVIGRAEVMDAVEPGGLGGTYGGAPVSCAAALAVLDVIEDEGLCARAEAIGERLRQAIEGFAARNDFVPIAGLRGLGAMIGFDIMADDRRTPDPAATRQVCARAQAEGLILLSCGTQGEAIRILVPLTVSDSILDEGIAMLGRALTRSA